MNYYLYHKNHNLVFKSIKEKKSESSQHNKIGSPWNMENLDHIFSLSNNSKLENFIDQNAKYKTEVEYHSNFGLFVSNFNRTYKPGLYFCLQNFKKDLLSKSTFGLTMTDVYEHISTITYIKVDKNPKFKTFLLEEAQKFNLLNPNEKLDLSLISKINNIAFGAIGSLNLDIPDSKHKVGFNLKLEQSGQSFKNQKLIWSAIWSKQQSFDLYLKMKAIGFSINSFDEKVIEEIKAKVI